MDAVDVAVVVIGAGAGAVTCSNLRPAAGVVAGVAAAIMEPVMTPFRPSGKKRPMPVVAPAVTMEIT